MNFLNLILFVPNILMRKISDLASTSVSSVPKLIKQELHLNDSRNSPGKNRSSRHYKVSRLKSRLQIMTTLNYQMDHPCELCRVPHYLTTKVNHLIIDRKSTRLNS